MVGVLHKKVVRELLRQKGQAAAVMMVVACGVGMYVTMRGGHMAMLSARDQFYRDYRFAEVFSAARRAPESVAGRIAAIRGVGLLETRLVVAANLDVPGLDEPASGRVVSLPRALNLLHVRKGRLPGSRSSGEVAVSESFAAANGLVPGDSFQALLNGRWTRLTITGVVLSPEYVYEIQPGSMFPDNRRFGVLWMGREQLAAVYGLEGAFNDLVVELGRGASLADVVADIDALLERYGGLGAHGRADQISHRFVDNEILQLKTSAIVVPAIFLGIAAFLTHVILSRVVSLQRGLIAVLKAFGYPDRVVLLHYLEFAAVPVALGAVAGAALGTWLGGEMATMYMNYFRFPAMTMHLDAWLALESAAVAALAALLGVIAPVRAAVALPPAEAMRLPRPAAYRSGLAERAGLARVPLNIRMILRNLERRPMRALLAVFLLGMGTGILLLGRFFTDAVEYLIRFQFELVDRGQAVVYFNEPKSATAHQEIARLPGVLATESFRAVGARLRRGHRTYRAALQGLPPDGELHRLLDRDERRVGLPGEGMLLTTALAEVLGVRPGDSIVVEVLEGSRPRREVEVAGTVDELLGMGAYMRIDSLNRLLRDGMPLSGSYLLIDGSRAPELYARLKRIPGVAGVVARDAMLASFRKTLAESMGIATTFQMGFACVIAFSIVFNGVRVALSERSHELASLRVLGFTRGEVAYILLGEQLLLLVLSIPGGFGIGIAMCRGVLLGLETELFRLPLVIAPRSYVIACVVIGLSALLSAAMILPAIWRMDLTSTLKARE